MFSFKRIFSKYVDAVVGNSQFAVDEHLKSGFFKNSKKFVVYNALESEYIGALPRKHGILNFGYMGILSYHKGIELVLGIFKEFNLSALNVFGSGITLEYEKYLKEKYASDKIIFHGFKKTEDAFKTIDVLIVPSLCYDTLPRVLYEAYSYGVPVLGSIRGGISEIIDNGWTGYSFNPEVKEDLLEKIILFKNNPEIISKMAPYCLEKAKDFLPEQVLKKYIDIYKTVCKLKKKS